MAAYASLLSLQHIIDTLENHPRPPISLPQNQVHLLTQYITSLLQFLESYNPNLPYSAQADPLETRIADAAHAAEDAIESHIVDHITNDNDGETMTDDVFHEAVEKLIEDMALIEKEAMLIKSQNTLQQLHTKSTPPEFSRSSSVAKVQQSGMVGADELLLQMKDKLTSDRLALQVIPIVGMGGSGKTTLAINIYQDRLIVEHFYLRAWVTISQEYSIREILAQLLKQLLGGNVSQDLSEGELGDMLHKHLFGRKYLIVLDDMWSIRAWDGVRMFLPDTKNGSRIVVTTRLSILASKLTNSSSLEMNLLDEDDSWDLLSKTVFGEKDCPIEFEEIGKEIGKGCKGLPLSIVVVGGLLAKSEQQHTIEYWEYIRENINSLVNLEDDERYLKILYMSYKQLPVHLKPCFLYMGVFPEDTVIRTKKIVRLWVAEGFLKPISKKNMEEIAKEYLEELIGRNLILIHKLGSIGNIKECKIHDLLRDLCLREAEKERFYTVVASPQVMVNNAAQQRIVVSSSTSLDEAINALSSMPLARTLIWNLEADELPPLNLRLLRILESSEVLYGATETCLESLYQMVNSRYIYFSTFKCPDSIARFWNLQTLYCKFSHLGPTTTFLLNMIHIRHIQSDIVEFDYDQLQGDDIILGDLQTLKQLSNFKCSKEIVKRIPNIKKLSIQYDSFSDDDKYCLTNLICLDKLESLRCEMGSGCESLERLISFPNSLVKLNIDLGLELFLDDILEKIGSLPLLQKLKLRYGRFKEGKWETTQGQFRSLKVLVLTLCKDLYVWTTECSHFQCLERLRLEWIDQLEEIPLDFAEIPTLKLVEVMWCRYSIEESAKRIVEEQEELYGESGCKYCQLF